MSEPLATATLIADRGEAAASEEFFRSRPFLDAEGVTHTLRIEGEAGTLTAPLIVRQIPVEGTASAEVPAGEPLLDAVSPYGYPGIVPIPEGGASEIDRHRGGQTAPTAVDFGPTGLVSAFIRHTLAEPVPLAGSRERNLVQIADPALPLKRRSSDRNQINKNRRNGYEVSLTAGPETTPAQRAGFLAAYEETMRRTGAAGHYFFDSSYFERILDSGATWLALATAPDDRIAAASIAARSDGFIHYYLSGTANAHLSDSPMKNVLAELVDLATAEGMPLNLGGGISRGDALEEFKRGFANRERAWCSSEIVCDAAAYRRLSGDSGEIDYFPAYRAPR